jgi:hypothetical protein
LAHLIAIRDIIPAAVTWEKDGKAARSEGDEIGSFGQGTIFKKGSCDKVDRISGWQSCKALRDL